MMLGSDVVFKHGLELRKIPTTFCLPASTVAKVAAPLERELGFSRGNTISKSSPAIHRNFL